MVQLDDQGMVRRIEELVYLVNFKKDNEAFEQLFLCLQPIIKAKYKNCGLKDLEKIDWLQRSLDSCYKACYSFCSSKGVPFISYYESLLEKQIIYFSEKNK
ncbi:hypothetical protein XA3_13700 [Xylocopilactobacillus apicola]|uniref:Bacteriocin immunity protein n=1 Tax=Xylocopilactobacillus apicola TaxID=2932184 RepID=A0AAU9D574_9LACO|nr:hypothetical protein XA3_13700 [Xylocopilactobacillus apicola]